VITASSRRRWACRAARSRASSGSTASSPTDAARPLPRLVQRQHHRPARRQPGADPAAARRLSACELGQVSRDGQVSVDLTSCTGLCDQGPALLVNDRAIGRLTPARIGAIASLIRGGSPVGQWPDNLFRIDSHIERRDLLLATPFTAGAGVIAALARGPVALRAEIEASGLRGRGGAGFSTASKWAACAQAPGPDRYVVCNADEGEPGTFKDRELLAHHLDLVLDGMTVAGVAVGASRGLLYLRGEYPFLIEPIEAALAARRSAGLLGSAVAGDAGFAFDIELHVGAGAYVCGEESALLESLEGKRGIPRNRPPYPVTHGYRQRPTVVNNVETLAAAALIAIHGGAWFHAVGTPTSAGTKLLSVSGDVARPGVYEYPFGVTVREVVDAAGAIDVQAVQVGGPSGTLLAAADLDRRIAFEDVPSAGAMMVFDRRRDILQVVDNFARFFAHESCGFCTPCRVGTTLNHHLMSRIRGGGGSRRDLEDLARVSQAHARHQPLRAGRRPPATRCSTPSPSFRPARSRRRLPVATDGRPGLRSRRSRWLRRARPPPATTPAPTSTEDGP
jgi:[NiFe] hydrogenase diaphorase moiety large subunit